jgi:hypothetical protein
VSSGKRSVVDRFDGRVPGVEWENRQGHCSERGRLDNRYEVEVLQGASGSSE